MQFFKTWSDRGELRQKRRVEWAVFLGALERSVSMKRLFDTVTVVDACGLSVMGLETGCAERRRAAPI